MNTSKPDLPIDNWNRNLCILLARLVDAVDTLRAELQRQRALTSAIMSETTHDDPGKFAAILNRATEDEKLLPRVNSLEPDEASRMTIWLNDRINALAGIEQLPS